MKKLILLTSLLIASHLVFAQLPLNVGLHVGTTTSKLKVDDVKTNSKTSFMFGAFARINLGPIYVEPALNYSQKKSTKDGLDFKYTSFDIPVMLGFHILDLSAMKLRAFVGPVASFPGKLKVQNLQGSLDNINKKNVTWNGRVGIGVDVAKFTLDVDYEKGLGKYYGGGSSIKVPAIYNVTLGFKIL
ncbi:MAG: PorT family protein [Culturomica sp.]|jgi:hypothetical protein|nr:PorT family protein [Culturomica sp.]